MKVLQQKTETSTESLYCREMLEISDESIYNYYMFISFLV